MTTPVFPSVEAHARKTVEQMFGYIKAQGDADYIGEAVSQLQHSLQTTTLARQAGEDKETVVGALLHDIGRFIPAAEKHDSMYNDDGVFIGKAGHEVLGEHYLRQLGFSEKVCQLVGSHVIAKRYLCAVDKDYYDGLSKQSQTTLRYQGGPFSEDQVKAAQEDPWLENKIALRRCDDRAKDPEMVTPPLDDFKELVVQSLLRARSSFCLHGKTYQIPDKPTVVVCIDGFDPEYLDHPTSASVMPTLHRFRESFGVLAKSAMPSVTNTNNVSIITGVPPGLHGISGNYWLDRKTREERTITDDSLLRGSTILAELHKRGVRVAAVTAKDKLRKILARGLDDAICFSTQECGKGGGQGDDNIPDVERWLGRCKPSQYSADLSVSVLDAGVKILEEGRADVLYLTLSDYIQHTYPPGSPESDALYRQIDERLAKLVSLGAQVAVTGDHGMSDKCNANGEPNVLYLEELLDYRIGKGRSRIICPIADPFVKHHGALGSFVRVYLAHSEDLDEALQYISSLPEVEMALKAEEAATFFDLPLDREGDIVVISNQNSVIGSRREEHDLPQLDSHRLRSHGGLSEQETALLMSRPAKLESVSSHREWRNFDIFDLILNH